MAQTDSQRSDSEDPESSNSPSDLPDSQIGGTVVEKGPLSEDESFQSSVGEMLDSIDAESAEGEISGGGDGDTIGAESVHPSDELLIRAGNILNGGDIPEPEEAAEIAEDEDADGLIDFPDPQSLLAEVDDQDQGLKEEGPDNADFSEVESVESEGLVSMPDPQSLMKEASVDVQIDSNRDPGPESEGPKIESEDREEEISLKEAFQGSEDSKEEVEEPVERNAEPFAAEIAEDGLQETVEAERAESDEKPEPEQEATAEPEANELEESSEENDPLADDDDVLLLDDDAGDDLFLDSEDGFSISGEDDDIDGVAAGFGGGSVDSSRAK